MKINEILENYIYLLLYYLILLMISFIIIVIIIFFNVYWIFNFKKINEEKSNPISIISELVEKYKFEKKWLDIDGKKIFVVERKSKIKSIPLIFVHGTWSSSQTFYHLISMLPDKYHCVTIDLPNFGISDSFDLDLQNEKLDIICSKYADLLEKFINKLGYNKVNLIGHSLGAIFSLYLAKKKCSLINKLFLLSIPGLFQSSGRLGFFSGKIFKYLLPPLLSRNFMIKNLEKTILHYYRDSDVILRYYLAITFAKSEGNCIIGRFISDYFLYGYWKKPLFLKLIKLKCETHVWIGKDDFFIDQYEDIFNKQKHNISIKKFNSSHNVFTSYDEFVETLKEELDRKNDKKRINLKERKYEKIYKIINNKSYFVSYPSLAMTDKLLKKKYNRIKTLFK